MSHQSTKTFCHNLGLSCCFRQWRARSHCSKLHGYALEVKLTFSATELCENGWVMDFGGLKEVKNWIESNFDHKLLVSDDDPHLSNLKQLSTFGVADVVVVQRTGCEAFAELVGREVVRWLTYNRNERVSLHSCEVREHGGNSAIWIND